MDKYLLIPLDDTVVFPNMTVTLPLDTGGDSRVLLVPRHDGVYAKVGTIAETAESGRLPGGARVVTVSGLHRALLGAAETGAGGRLYVDVDERPDETPPPVKTRELETEYRAVVQEILELRDADPRIGEFLRSVVEPGALADTAAYSPDLTFEQRVRLLETVDVVERLELALALQRERLAELEVRRRIRDDVESGAQAQQREYFLRKQLDAVRERQVRRVGGRVGERARLDDRAQELSDAWVGLPELEDLFHDGAVLGLELTRLHRRRRLVLALLDLDIQPACGTGLGGAEQRAVKPRERDNGSASR